VGTDAARTAGTGQEPPRQGKYRKWVRVVTTLAA
jgi:hypothetical protein